MITSIAKPRFVRAAGLTAGAVAIAAAAIWVTASAAGYNIGFSHPAAATQPTSASLTAKSTRASAACTDFVNHFASDLGTNQAKVDAAVQQAIGQTLADEVKNGDLTQTQADAIKKKLAGRTTCTLASGVDQASGATIGAYTQTLLTAAASALGISDQQLKTDLAAGMSLSQIAAAQKPPVTEAQFRTKLIANLKPLLDKAVANKQLTSAQEQAIIQKLQTGPIPFWSKPMHKAEPPATGTPSATSTTG